MAHRTVWLVAVITACLTVGATAQCNLIVQDVPLYAISCPGDNYTAIILYYNSGNGPCNVAAEVTLSTGVVNLTFGVLGNGRTQPDGMSDIGGISLNPIPGGTSVVLAYVGTVSAAAAGTNITSVAAGTPVGGSEQMATATTQVLTFPQCGFSNPPPVPPSPGPPPPVPPPPVPSPPPPMAPKVVAVLSPRPTPHPAPHPTPHPKPTAPPQDTTVTLGAAQRGAVTASSVRGCLHLKTVGAGQEVVIVIKPELHTNGSVKMNPNSLVRSSLRLSGIAARKAKNGSVVANYRSSTHTLAIAFPSSVRKFKSRHTVVLTGRYKVSKYRTAAFKSTPIPVC